MRFPNYKEALLAETGLNYFGYDDGYSLYPTMMRPFSEREEVYKVLDKQKFMLAVMKYGIEFNEYKPKPWCMRFLVFFKFLFKGWN